MTLLLYYIGISKQPNAIASKLGVIFITEDQNNLYLHMLYNKTKHLNLSAKNLEGKVFAMKVHQANYQLSCYIAQDQEICNN